MRERAKAFNQSSNSSPSNANPTVGGSSNSNLGAGRFGKRPLKSAGGAASGLVSSQGAAGLASGSGSGSGSARSMNSSWESRIKKDNPTSSSSNSSSNPTFMTNGNGSGSSSKQNGNVNGFSKVKGLGLDLEATPIKGLESESYSSDQEEEEEGPTVPVKPYPPRLTLTKGISNFDSKKGSSPGSVSPFSNEKTKGGFILSPLRTGFELQEEDDLPPSSSASNSITSISPAKPKNSPTIRRGRSNERNENGKISPLNPPPPPAEEPPSISTSNFDSSTPNSPESSFSKRRTAYRSGFTDGETDGEGYADEVEIATASVSTVRRVGVSQNGQPSSSATIGEGKSSSSGRLGVGNAASKGPPFSRTSDANSTSISGTPLKSCNQVPVPQLLASSPSGSSRPLEPIPSSTSLNTMDEDSFHPRSKSREAPLSALDSDEEEEGMKAVSRYSSARKNKSKMTNRSNFAEQEDYNRPNPASPNETYETSTDGSTVLASIFDDSDGGDSSPIETIGPSSRDSLLRQLAAEQARVDVNTFKYSVLSSDELEEAQTELMQLERRAKDVRHKLVVRTRIRDAAVKLRRAHRRTPSQSASGGTETRDRRNPSISTAGGYDFPPSPALPSPGLPPTPTSASIGRNRSATFTSTSVGKAEVDAEASALAASENVDKVAEELLSISERTSHLRKIVTEHQAAILAFRVDSLENERRLEMNRKSRVDGNDLKNKFREREKSLMDQINQTRKELSEVRNLERNRKQEVNEIRTQLQNTLNLRKQDQDDNLELRNALDLASRNRASEGEKQGLIEVENALKDAQQRLVEAQDSERKAIMERNSLEKRSSEAESSRNHLNQESSTSLTKLRNDLRNCETTLEVTTNQLREAEIKHRDLERSFQKEKKLFEERALLFHEFERNLNQTEETLKGEEKRLAEMLGKVDGREEMDDLLSMIKSGGNANKKDKDRLAGQGIEDLLRNVSEHIQDLGEELKRLEGSNERRGRPSYDDDEDDERGSRTIRRDFKVRKTRSQSRGASSIDDRDRDLSSITATSSRERQLVADLEKARKEAADSAAEREQEFLSQINQAKEEAEVKEKASAKALEDSKPEIEKLKLQKAKPQEDETSKLKLNNKVSSSPFKSNSNRDFKDIQKIDQLEKMVEKLKREAAASTSGDVSREKVGGVDRSFGSEDESQVSASSQDLLEARKILKEISSILPATEMLSRFNNPADLSTSSSISSFGFPSMDASRRPPAQVDSHLSALALVLQPGSSKALPSIPSSSDLHFSSSSSTTSFTSLSDVKPSELDINALPERLRATLAAARSAALMAKDADANVARVGKDTAEAVMEKEMLRARQDEEHQKLIERTQKRVKGL